MTTPTLAEVVAALNALGVRLWRWPGDTLGTWPPTPDALAAGVAAHKYALLDLADARGDRDTPAWARQRDADGWYSTPGEEQIRFREDGTYELRMKPELVAALAERVRASPEDGWRALVEGTIRDDRAEEPWDR